MLLHLTSTTLQVTVSSNQLSEGDKNFNFFALATGTLHLKEKNPSTKISWGFECVLDTIYHYWIYPDKQFYQRFTGCRDNCDSSKSIVQKGSKWNMDTTFKENNLLLPLKSVSEIFLGCTKKKLWFFYYASTHPLQLLPCWTRAL